MNFIKMLGALIIVCSSAWVGLDAAKNLRRTREQMQILLDRIAEILEERA